MDSLYCQKCDYNLTGLPENRCPECGQWFIPSSLTPGQRFGRRPISTGAATLWLLWPPAVLHLTLLPLPIGQGKVLSDPALPAVCAVFLLIYGLFSSFVLSRRLSVGRLREKTTLEARRNDLVFVIVMALLLYSFHVVVAAGLLFGACVISFKNSPLG